MNDWEEKLKGLDYDATIEFIKENFIPIEEHKEFVHDLFAMASILDGRTKFPRHYEAIKKVLKFFE